MLANSAALATKLTALTNSVGAVKGMSSRDPAADPAAVATASAAPASTLARTSCDSTTTSAASDNTPAAWMRASVELTAATMVISHRGAAAAPRAARSTMTAAHSRSAATARPRRGRRSTSRLASQLSTSAGTYLPTVTTATHAAEWVRS